MPKALVFGTTGLLGQALIKTLRERYWEVQEVTRQGGDFTSPDFLKSVIVKANADYIFNAAAWTAVDDAEDKPAEAYAMNRDFPSLLSQILANQTRGRLIHYGTDFIFSGSSSKAKLENDLANPESVYGKSKYEGENRIREILPDRSCVIRTAWLFGPGRKNFVETILNVASQRDNIKVVNDQTGSPTYAPDLADWSEKLAKIQATGVFHGVNSGFATWHKLAQKAIEMAGINCNVLPISSSEWPQKAKRPEYSVLANAKLAGTIAEKPRHWEDALKDYIKIWKTRDAR